MPGAYGHADPLFLLLAALALEAYVGSLGWLRRIVVPPRRRLVQLARQLQRRLDRPQRGERILLLRGMIVTLLLVLAAAAAGWALALLTRFYPFAWAIELVVLIVLLRQRRTISEATAVHTALAVDDCQAARDALKQLAGSDYDPTAIEALPAVQIPSTTLRPLARRFTDSLVAPVFWFVVAGLAGLFIQQALRLLSALYGRPRQGSAPPSPFAVAARRLDHAACWLPDRLAGLLLTAAAFFTPHARPEAAWRCLGRVGHWAEAALGGAVNTDGKADDSRTRLSAGIGLFAVASLLQAALLALLLSARLVLT